ncbi:MAG: SRPBCC family protein [Planctomycetota bacterium]
MSDGADETIEPTPPPAERVTVRRPWWMGVMVGFGVLVVLGNVVAFLYAHSLPDSWSVTRSVEIDADVDAVLPLVATPARWPDWSAFSTVRDASLVATPEGPESGAGATLRWTGQLFGNGTLTIASVTDSAVKYDIVMHGQPFSPGGEITFVKRDDGGVTVTWTDGGPFPDTMSKLFGSVIEDGIARDFGFGLDRLKRLAETGATPARSAPNATEAGSSAVTADE